MQVSSKKISSKQEQQIFERLHFLLAKQSNPNEIAAFLATFLTQTEHLVFAKRLAIFFLLNQGKSYSEIKTELQVSSATISTVAENINNDSIQKAIQKINIIDQTNMWFKKAKKIWS